MRNPQFRLPSLPIPAAVAGRVRAESDMSKLVSQLNTEFQAFKDRQDTRINGIEASQDEFARQIVASSFGPLDVNSLRPEDPEYSKLFASYFRNGSCESDLKTANAAGRRAEIHAAMSVGTNDAGGYLAPNEWDRRISNAQRATSPIRRISDVQVTGRNAYFTLWNDQAWGTGWVGETAARPDTATPTFSPIDFATGELYASPSVTQRLLDDADFDFQAWLVEQLNTEFARQEGIAFVSGNGTNKPFGFLQYVTGGTAAGRHPGGNLDVFPGGAAALLGNADSLVDFTYGLAAPYRQNATWVMNSQTAAGIAKMKDGQGNFIWRESLVAGQPSTLLGRPVELDESMPAIGANALAIAFGDFKAGYLINDRMGTRILRDPYTNKPYVSFYTTKRVGAGVKDPRAIRLYKISVS
ncbi:MAG: phage major capsid protein [Sphingomonas sp.]